MQYNYCNKHLNLFFFFQIIKYISKILPSIFATKQLKIVKSFTFTNVQVLLNYCINYKCFYMN